MKKMLLFLALSLYSLAYGQTAEEPSNISEPGAGTAANPYHISNLGNLYWITRNTTRLSKNYEQTADINASASGKWNAGAGWIPIGNSTSQFSGVYDGKGHTIDSLYINRSATDFQGLFGFSSSAIIKNVGLINVKIVGKYGAGALVGYSYYSVLSNCFSSGNVTGNSSAGGLVGWNYHSSVNNCYSSCSVNGGDYTGGLVGNNDDYSAVSYCYSIGMVTSSSSFKGGLIGYNHLSTVTNCFWNKTINPTMDNGQSTGKTTDEMKSYFTYTNSGWDFIGEPENGTNSYWGIDEINEQNNGYPFLQWQGYSQMVKPIVTTQTVSNITPVSATGNGNITFWGYPAPSQYGVCWSTSQYPTINDSKSELGSPPLAGSFSSSLTGLLTNTTYYTRAYVINNGWISYGDVVSFSYTGFEGSGTEEDPYLIKSLNDLKYMSDHPPLWDKYFKQTSDINASVTSTWNDSNGWMPIGNEKTYFSGKYDGDGHLIDSLTINRTKSEFLGFFGRTNGCRIEKIGLTNIDIKGGGYAGGLAGGVGSSVINNCSGSGSINSVNNAGGLIGYSYNSTINNSYSSVSVSGMSSIGGLVGQTDHSTINSSFSSGNVNGMGDRVGGLVGEHHSSSVISNCYSRDSVNGHALVGGLVGYSQNSSISYCYSSGKVSGTLLVGPLVGSGEYVENANCFWDKTVNPDIDNGIGTGLNINEMKTHSIYLSAGWDFLNEVVNGSGNYWGMNETGAENEGYPFLKWQGYSDLMITELTPFLVTSIIDLKYISDYPPLWDKHFKQTADINASASSTWNDGTGWIPPGNETMHFTGKYDGDGYSIDSLTISRAKSDYQGFIGYADSAVINNVLLTNLNINGGSYTGGLAGYNIYSKIDSCYSSGNINGDDYVGGISGEIISSSMSDCGSSSSVKGSGSRVGGLVGGGGFLEINRCLDTGSVNGVTNAGGLIGYCYNSTTSNSYSSANVSGISSIGGLMGEADKSTISCSFSSSNVNGLGDQVGGLVGNLHSSSTISNCYNRGSVNGNALVGGLVGYSQNSSISYCYSSGKISGNLLLGGLVGDGVYVENGNCFWDTTVNPDIDNGIGTGKASAEMKIELTYINAGWDFNEIWKIAEVKNDGYPMLRWQKKGLGGGDPTSVVENLNTPVDFKLSQNYPNPFNPTTVISYQLPVTGNVQLKVYDILGTEIVTLVNEVKAPGYYKVTFDAGSLSSGVYIYRINAGSFSSTKKLVLIK